MSANQRHLNLKSLGNALIVIFIIFTVLSFLRLKWTITVIVMLLHIREECSRTLELKKLKCDNSSNWSPPPPLKAGIEYFGNRHQSFFRWPD